MTDEELVMVGERTTGLGAPCRLQCGFNVVIEGPAEQALSLGGSLICKPCAEDLARRHPEAFKNRADL